MVAMMTVSTTFAAYTASADLDAKIDMVEDILVETLLWSSESTAMQFVDVLAMYETKFETEWHERNLYVVRALMYDIVPMVTCVFNDGVYLTGVRECEWLNTTVCTAFGGEYNECGSACRNDADGSICTMECVMYCDMMPNDMMDDDTSDAVVTSDEMTDTDDADDMTDDASDTAVSDDDMSSSHDTDKDITVYGDCTWNNPTGANCF